MLASIRQLSTKSRVAIAACVVCGALALSSVSFSPAVYSATLRVNPVIGFLTFAQVQPSITRCVDQVEDIKATAKSKGTIDKVAITFTKNNTCNGAKITVNAVDSAGHTGTGSAILDIGASGKDQIAISGDVESKKSPKYYLIIT